MTEEEKKIAEQKIQGKLLNLEEIQWVGESVGKQSLRNTLKFLQYAYLTYIFFGVLFFVIGSVGGFLFSIPIFIIGSIISGFIVFLLKMKLLTFYFVTNKRIVTHRRLTGYVFSLPYSRIPTVRVKDEPDSKGSTINFRKLTKRETRDDGYVYHDHMINSIEEGEIEEVLNLIAQNIRKEGRFKPIHQVLEKLEKELDLEYVKKDNFVKKKLVQNSKLEGKYEGLDFELSLEGVLSIIQLEIKISCPNPEDNALRISSESIFKKLDKLLGAQDVQIGNRTLDKKYIFQTDHHDFLHSILSDSTKKLLNFDYTKKIKEITFGNVNALKKERKLNPLKSKPKVDESVLDSHLVTPSNEEETKEIKELNPNQKNDLNYSYKIAHKHTDKEFSKDLYSLVLLLTGLAKEIKNYYEK